MRISDWSSDVCSSDLRTRFGGRLVAIVKRQGKRAIGSELLRALKRGEIVYALPDRDPPRGQGVFAPRSEEHTSELQSLMRISYAVFCLKKKTETQAPPTTDQPVRYHTRTNYIDHITNEDLVPNE